MEEDNIEGVRKDVNHVGTYRTGNGKMQCTPVQLIFLFLCNILRTHMVNVKYSAPIGYNPLMGSACM